MKARAKAKKKKNKTSDKPKKEEGFFREVEFECSNCHKKVKMISIDNYSTEGFLCQRCGLGEEKPDLD